MSFNKYLRQNIVFLNIIDLEFSLSQNTIDTRTQN